MRTEAMPVPFPIWACSFRDVLAGTPWPALLVRGVWFSSFLLATSLDAQQPFSLRWAPGCAECTVSVETAARISSEHEDAGPVHATWTVSEDPLGRFWASFAGEDLVHVYGPDGETLAVIGRSGEGPGEYRTAMALVAVADSMVLFDQALGRLTVFGPDFQPTRTLPLAGAVVIRGAALDWPYVAVNAIIPTADAIGYPFHILNLRTGAIERSFGGTGEYTPADGRRMFGHISIDPVTGDIWTALRTRFQVQRWSRNGQLVATYTALPEFFRDEAFGSLGSPRHPPDGVVTALATAKDGLIRIAVKVPRPDWRDAWPRGPDSPTGPHRSARDVPPQRKLYRNQIAILDPTSGMILSLTDVSFDTTGPGNIVGGLTALEDLDDLFPALNVLRVSVRRGGRTVNE